MTNGQWAMPKHLLLGMSVRHLTGSAELITVLNRFGHCASYSVLLELETAMCSSMEQWQSAIPPSIVPDQNSFIHLCWDNFDLTEETLSGAGTTHTAHGNVIQEMFTSADSDACSDQQSLPKDKKRSVTVVPHVIEPYYTKKRAEPNLTVSNTIVEETSSEKLAKFSDILWILTRFCSSSSEQTVPGWAGWITLTSSDNHDTQRQ